MKRIFSIILVAILMFSLCGCKDGKKKGENGVDIEYYVNLGQIPENEITLGTSRDKLISVLNKRGEEAEKQGEHYGYNEIEGENNVLIEEGPYDYYYKKADSDKKVAYIVSYLDAFDFKLGDVIIEVKEALKEYDVNQENANENNAFFYFGDYSKAQVLKITFEKNSVLFLFEGSALCATAVYSNNF